MSFGSTELILTDKGKVYHLNVSEEDLSNHIILVGDQNRVEQISRFFSKIDFTTQHREFVTHTGWFQGKRITVMSTGIGTDNIDITVNELDAAVNINPQTRELRPSLRKLYLYRLGTSGSIQPDVNVDNLVVSTHGIGMDGLLNFYRDKHNVCEQELELAFRQHMDWPDFLPYPYIVPASSFLLSHFSKDNFVHGMTVTAPGFYAPQGRNIRLKALRDNWNEQLAGFTSDKNRIVNFEMETSALYGLGKMLGHECITICVIIGNRPKKEFTSDYHRSVKKLIEKSLNVISQIEN
jgi:uridine phosphorylase